MIDIRILKISAVTLALAVTGCGGGDGYYDLDTSSNSSTSTTTTPTTTETSLNISNITLLDVDGNATTSISADGAIAKVTVTDSNGTAISGALVTFSSSGNLTFSSSNGAVLSDADGVATISMTPTEVTDTGSYTLSATATSGDLSATSNSLNYSIVASNVRIEDLAVANTNLESGGSTVVSLATVNSTNNVAQNNVTVNFSTSCGSFTSSSVVSSNQGNVSNTYSSISSNGVLCSGTQSITATTSSGQSSTINVQIASAEVSSIQYTTTSTLTMGIKGSGTSSSGQVEFTVYSNGTGVANKDVLVELLQAPTDTTFISPTNTEKQYTLQSDTSGKVIVNIYPGATPGPVEIKASLVSDPNINALSKNVVIASGRATQNGFSLSVSKNSLQNSIDGDSATITARLVDKYGNTVPDGTVVSFVSEGGKVGSSCATEDGNCSVTLTTQNPRPLDNRVTVLAYVEGDKSFTDVDGDKIYTEGTDSLVSNIGDFFRDDNEDLLYNSEDGEFVYRRNDVGDNCAASTIKQPNIPATCANTLAAVLRQQLLFAFAEETAVITGQISSSTLSFRVYGNSLQSVPMPSGSSIAVTAEDNTENSSSCTATLETGNTTVANVWDLLTPDTFIDSTQVYYEYTLKNCAVGDSLRVTVTSPSGSLSNVRYYVP